MDEIEKLEAEGKAERAAKKAERKTPEAKAKRNTGRAQKNRGYRAEKRIEGKLENYGFKRMPMSGALGGSWSGDLRRDSPEYKTLQIVEVKHRDSGWTQLRKWLAQGNADLLILDEGANKDFLCVVTGDKFIRLLEEAGYEDKHSYTS